MSWEDVLKKPPVWDIPLPKGKFFTLSQDEKINRNMEYSGRGASWKPSGLWFSMTDKYNWIDWLKNNEPLWEYQYQYLITFDISGNILRIRNEEDMKELMEEYTVEIHPGTSDSLDWGRLMKEYDAAIFEYHGISWKDRNLRWEKDGKSLTPLARQSWLESLDVDSGVVWNLDSITNEKVYAQRKIKRGHKRTAARKFKHGSDWSNYMGRQREAMNIAGKSFGDWVII